MRGQNAMLHFYFLRLQRLYIFAAMITTEWPTLGMRSCWHGAESRKGFVS